MVIYYNKKIVIVGLGKTGLSCVNFFLSHKIIPFVMDTRKIPPGKYELPSKVMYHYGSWNLEWLTTADLIVISPGISLIAPDPELKVAIDKGIEIVGDIELFCREVKKPIIAITGSNGKSTVTSLVAEMAKKANFKVAVGGNIGIPVLTLLKNDYDLYVLELSSFQLETIFSLKAEVATILNITEDHMDRYPQGFEQYRMMKLRIYNDAKVCIVNKQDPTIWPLNGFDERCISFDINDGDYQLNTFSKELEILGQSIIDTDKLRLIGQHNHLNAVVALALADAVNIPRKASIAALTQYIGLPHRFQIVHQHLGIKWINDSKSTNVGSTIAALKSLEISGMIYLLLGGDGKSIDFSSLKSYISAKNIQLFCFGRDRNQLAKLKENSFILNTMEECLHVIVTKLKAGDVVLLSPACASLDQFYNFEDRGEQFIKLAKELCD
ncbi:UDP-N-acetylmuramoylalanine--D-glutamate ligase [Candidatus Arsenophonus lipoptenae]|uniref:UDP-N-acetylmuramoylalanine--D-glutamate ligase n=1 Tax=Candidatus Arsenophonus lipoptenae TaxID=634113 RepID=A0A120HPX5_9GAMM|nr:UDP-N-acetylmuramoyl-L-alanine--D-glutamate ligase [Candidatus Arsenophonus lipoptenae]AMA65100.1 UDP-N-acetylmuramoylalanine--D-glutamate ligase [Candidatus Arsenophonus lipoptenae]